LPEEGDKTPHKTPAPILDVVDAFLNHLVLLGFVSMHGFITAGGAENAREEFVWSSGTNGVYHPGTIHCR